jgi:RHS repeat-associated protein
VGDFFGRLPNADYLPTWHALRTAAAHAAAFAARYPDATDRTNETRAAGKTRVHAATPTVAHADSLGRTFLTVAHNKLKYSDTPAAAPSVEEFHATRIVLDIEGNQREVIDAKDRVVMRYDYDMLGNRVHQASMEAGQRWMLNDVAGKPLYAWDSRDHRFRTSYDPLRRPTDSFLSEGGGAEMVVGRSIYGEGRPNPQENNLCGKVVELNDQAGIVASDRYDFKGNLLEGRRRLAQEYKTTLDWSGAVPLEPETYTSRTRYDALNRPIQLIAPHSDQPGATINVIQPRYNEANLLEQVHAWLNGNTAPGSLLDPASASLHTVTDIDYDAKGQRMLIDYGNGVRTTYTYDPLTFRLTHLLTRRSAATFPSDCLQPPPAGWPGCQVQNLHYTCDPAGNITHIRDDAQQTIYFRNKRVEPSAEYTYDAVYRLIEATGREHLGQAGGAPIPHSYNDALRVGLVHPGDGNAMGTYLERYVYDALGNFLEMQHRGSDPAHPGWTRTYAYNETSQLEHGKQSNRLTSTTIGGTTETYSNLGDGYDGHGNMLRMPHLQDMQWDLKDQLLMTQRQKVNDEDADGAQHLGERTWYVYDSTGQRVRKVTESASGQVKGERIYLGGFEIYRKKGATPHVRETLHIMDDKQRIALVETRTHGTDPAPAQLIRYQFGNHLGSANLELDDQAHVISYEEYTPYGSTSFQAVRSQTETAKRYRFTGKERDEESRLYYHGARYYAAWLGRWISSDPAGLVDGRNLYRFVQNAPIRLIDQTGKQSADPTLLPQPQGFGLTFGGGKVRIGPLTPPPQTVCDELNPACSGLTLNLNQSKPGESADTSQQSGADPGRTFDPSKALKTYAPPLPNYIWRKSNPSVDPNPYKFGFDPKDPTASYSLGEHALGQHLPKGSQYISGTHKPGGPSNFNGDPYAINPESVPPTTKMHDTPEIMKDLERLAKEGNVAPERVEKWKGAQETIEGVHTKPGQGPKGEVLFEGNIPAQAVEGGALRALRGAARGLFWVGVAFTAYDLGAAAVESFRQGSIKPLAREVVRQSVTWGAAIGGAKVGAIIGSAFGPVGTVVGGLIGGILGGIGGWIAGSWLSSLFWS